MPVSWQPIDLPLGQGVDQNSNRAALPPGKLILAQNCHFGRSGGITKRTAFDTSLGEIPSGFAARLAAYGERLIARGSGVLSEAVPANTSIGSTAIFVNRGACRSVPTSATIVKSSNDDIPACDAFSAGGMTCVAWLDGTTLYTQITDESTGAVVNSNSFTSSTFGGITPAAGFQVTGSPGFGAGMWFFVTFAGYVLIASSVALSSSWTWRTVSPAVAAPSGSYWLQSRIAVQGANLCIGMISADGTKAGAALLTFTGTTTSSGSTTGINADTNCTMTVVYYSAISAFGVIYRNFGGSLAYSRFNASTMAFVSTLTVAADAWTHISAIETNATVVLVFDVLATTGTYQASVRTVTLTGTTFGSVTTLLRSVSLAGDLVLVQSNGNVYFEAVYHSQVSATLANTVTAGSVKPDGTTITQAEINALTLPTINGAIFVCDISGNVCARVMRGLALTRPNISSGSTTGSGVLWSARVVSQAETATVQQALQLGAVALVRFNSLLESARGVEAAREHLAVGGCANGYDGVSPTEIGFHTFPEIPILLQAQTDGTFSGQISGLWNQRNTAYAAGTVADQEGLDPIAGLTKTYNGNLWLCVVGGTTSGSIPSGYYGGALGTLVVDGTSTWQCLGLRLPQTYASGISVSVGHMFVPSTGPAGFMYIVAATDSHGARTTATEPTWPTTAGANVVIAASGGIGTITYVAIALSNVGLTAGTSYTYGTVYSWVDGQGQLYRSAMSPTAGIALTNSPPIQGVLIVTTTQRLTQKSNVRAEVHRTDGNGTVLEQINTLASNTTVDLVGLLDVTTDTSEEIGGLVYQGPLGAGGLPNQPPPSCSSMAIFGRRVWANSLESPHTLFPSQLLVDGYGISWADELAVQIDDQGGAIQALQEMDGALIVFQDHRISYIAGDGPDNTGAGDGFFTPQVIAADVGCSNPDSIVLCPAGIVFQAPRGIYLLDRSRSLKFIGEPVQTLITGTVTQAAIDPHIQQVLLLVADGFNGPIYTYDYARDAWGEWDVSMSDGQPQSLVQWQNSLVVCDDNGEVYKQSGTSYVDAGGNYALACTLAPIRLAGEVAGYGRVRGANIQFMSASSGNKSTIQISVLEDYSDSTAYTLPTIQLEYNQDSIQALFRNQKLTAVALNITESTPGDFLEIEGIQFEVGVERGLARRPPSTKRIG